MQELLNTVEQLVRDALGAAENIASETIDGYVQPLLDLTQQIYNAYLASGLTPEEAADATEKKLREITGMVII